MITLDEIIAQQREFDQRHKSRINWSEEVSDQNVEVLEYLLLATLGELGEAANLVKKVVRGDKPLSAIREKLSEEIIDILIYAIKLTYQMNIDVEKVYHEKMRRNEKRFKHYER